jgi:hypothetical protein
MKKIILTLITGLIFLESAMTQEIPHRIIPSSSFEKDKATQPKINTADYFLQKSTKLQSTAWKLAGIGGALGISGILLYDARNNNQNQMGESAFYAGGGMLLMITGTGLIVISIPLYFESIHYKNKALAMTASLNLESCHDLNQTGMLVKHYPALVLNIHL